MKQEVEELFDNLLMDCKRSDAKEKLKLFKSVLDKQVEHGVKEFNLSYTASQSKSVGGPSYSTINNAPGKRYRTLFNKYKEIHGAAKARPALPKDNTTWIDNIEDTADQYKIKAMQSQLKKLKAENDSLKQLKSEMVIELKNFDGGIEAIQNKSEVREIKTISGLLTSEKETLMSLLNESYLKSRSLSYDDIGRLVITVDGEIYQVSDRKFRNAIEKLLTVG